MPEHKLNRDKTVAVSTKAYWMRIDESTPRGVKLLLANRKAGSGTTGSIGTEEKFFTHWFPYPAFPKDEEGTCAKS